MSSEPWRKSRRYRGGRKAGPADAHEQKGEICLPWHRCVANLDHTAGQGDPAKRNDGARTITFDAATHRYQKQCADHVEKGDSTRDETGGPAVRRDHLMEIDTRAKQAECVSDQRREHAGGDNPPAVEDTHMPGPTDEVFAGRMI